MMSTRTTGALMMGALLGAATAAHAEDGPVYGPTAADLEAPVATLAAADSVTASAPGAASVDDQALLRRLTEPTGSGSIMASPSRSPWWMWPLGMIGAIGAAGLVYRSRRTDGVSDEIVVLSRTGLSRTASLAMIEVVSTDGRTRRMLIGVGGGAPRLVADLSDPTPVQAALETPAVGGSVSWFVGAEAADDELEPEEVAPEPTPTLTRVPPRRNRRSDRESLVAEVLAERGSSEEPRNWKDPWARNFEAMLGKHAGGR